jgi:electron transfer flavoprotein beta subunit
MRIAVCIKSVPDPDYYDQIIIDPKTKVLVRQGIPTIINISDKHAIEEALRIKERTGGEITTISMGPPMARQQMLESLAMGADRAFLVSDRKVGGADTLATSYTLSKAIEKTGPYDLVLLGNESADGATAHVPSQLGEWLGMSHAANVVEMQEEEGSFVVTRKLDDGFAKYRLKSPAVVGVSQRINKVRLTNAIAILKAKKKPLEILSADDLGDIDEKYIGLKGSPSQNGELHTVEAGKDCVMIEAENEAEAAQKVYDILAPVLGLKGGK